MKNKKIKSIAVVLIALICILGIFVMLRHNLHKKEIAENISDNTQYYTCVANLYALKPDGTYILKDTEGNLWEVDKNVNINENDQLLLEISGNNITHIWVEMVIDTGNVDGETPES